MNKFILSVAVVLLLSYTACIEENDFDSQPLNYEQNNSDVNSRQVTQDQALKFAEMFDASVAKSLSLSKSKVLPRTICDVQYVISDNNDTLVYILNYADSRGYLLLSADKNSFPILAVSDTGNINLQDKDTLSSFYHWLDDVSTRITSDLSCPLDSFADNNLWNDIDNEDCIITMELDTETSISKKKKTTSEYDATLFDYHKTTGSIYKWGQGEGYNYYSPRDDDGNLCLVGCPAVAIGLVCKANAWPYNYRYHLMPPNLINSNEYNSIAIMFRDIAEHIPNYFWGAKLSGTKSEDDIVTGLKRIGYTDAKVSSFNISLAYNEIKNGNPILLSAYQSNLRSGHVWYCDGYKSVRYKFVKSKRNGKKIINEWYETYDYLLMNWGWNGDCDAWYRYDTNCWASNLNYNRSIFTGLHKVE